MVSNEPYTFSIALLESKHRSCLFMICQYGPLQKIVRLALSRELLSSSLSLFSWVTVAPLWPSLPHLSPCQDSSFIYRKAFTQINTATQQLPCTHTHSPHTWAHASAFCAPARTPDFGLWSKQNKTRLFWARLFVWFLSFFLSIVLAQHTFLIFHPPHFWLLSLSSSIFSPLYPWESGGLSWRRWSEELEGKQMIG